MKAISPVRSVRSCYEAVCCLSDQSLAIARGSPGKSSALEEPMSLLYDMNDCYSKLRELVPGIPQGTKLSQVEILQHVIDYIFDLQIVLEEQAKGQDPSAETSLLSLKASELASELCSKDETFVPLMSRRPPHQTAGVGSQHLVLSKGGEERP